MTMAQKRKDKAKKRVVVVEATGQAHIKASFNNIIIWGDISAPDDVTRIDVTGDLEIRDETGSGAGLLSLG